ncbi:MAG: hypothetical protein U0792_04980 [Gemmataceae bacterium]
MARPLPVVDVNTHLDEPYRLLLAGYGVLATSEGKIADIVTRIDLILLGPDPAEVIGVPSLEAKPTPRTCKGT